VEKICIGKNVKIAVMGGPLSTRGEFRLFCMIFTALHNVI